MPKDIDLTKQHLQVDKAYRITWKYNYTMQVVKDVYIFAVTPHKVIGEDRVYTWSYCALLENPDEDSCHDYCLYLWNKLDSKRNQDLYNADSIVELSKEDYPRLKRFRNATKTL